MSRTTLAGLVAAVSYFLSTYMGVVLTAEVQAAVVSIAIFLIGFFAQDAAASKKAE